MKGPAACVETGSGTVERSVQDIGERFKDKMNWVGVWGLRKKSEAFTWTKWGGGVFGGTLWGWCEINPKGTNFWGSLYLAAPN